MSLGFRSYPSLSGWVLRAAQALTDRLPFIPTVWLEGGVFGSFCRLGVTVIKLTLGSVGRNAKRFRHDATRWRIPLRASALTIDVKTLNLMAVRLRDCEDVWRGGGKSGGVRTAFLLPVRRIRAGTSRRAVRFRRFLFVAQQPNAGIRTTKPPLRAVWNEDLE